MPDFDEIMKMAQQAQADLQRAQDNLDKVEVEGVSGGGLVSFAAGELVLKPLKPLGPDFTRDLSLAAKEATGQNWQVRLAEEGGEPSLQQQEAMAEERARAAILDEPPVRAILEQYPEAILETVTRKEA